MAGYTTAEVDAAVSRFVKSKVTVTKDVLGPVDMSARFDEVMELFSSTLILDPNSLFYLIYLASNRLCADVSYSVSLVDDVLQAIYEIQHPPTKITQTSLLSDAAAHLSTMDTILAQSGTVTQNTVGKTGVVATPYDRYVQAVDTFRDVSLAPNIKVKGAIVRSAQEARTSAISSLNSLRTLYPDLLARADILVNPNMGMVAQFNALKLQTFALQRSLRQARGDLLTLQKALEDPTTSDVQKTALTRDAYLRITAGKSVITGLKDANNPMTPRMQTTTANGITGSVSKNSSSVLVVASVATGNIAPWPIQAGVSDTLVIAEDGHTPTSYTITVHDAPSVTSFNDTGGTFVIQGYSAATITTGNAEPFVLPVISKKMYVTVDGKLFQGTVTEGTRTANQIIADLNALAAPDLSTLNAVITISKVAGKVVLTHSQTGLHSINITDSDQPGHGYLTALGLSTPSASSTGKVANNKLCIDGHLITLTVGTRTPTQIAADVNVLSPYHATAVGNLIKIENTSVGAASITMTVPTAVPADKETVLAAYSTIGFFEGQTDSSTSVSAAELAKSINDVGKVLATVVRVHDNGVTKETVRIDSILNDLPTKLVIGAGTANTLLGLTPGAHAGTVTGFSATASFEDADVVAGDTLRVNGNTTGSVVAAVSKNLLEVSPPLATDLVVSSFIVESEDYLAYKDFTDDTRVESMPSWKTHDLGKHPEYASNTLELDRLMNPVLGNTTPTAAEIAAATTGAQDLRNILQHAFVDVPGRYYGLQEVLTLFVVRPSARIDAAINMLHERGFDRAYATLMNGDLADFFGYDKDAAASASYMLQTMRSLVQNDLTVTNKSTTADDTTLISSVQTSDANYDRSDVDKDENINLLGSVPDLDSDATVPADYYKQVF